MNWQGKKIAVIGDVMLDHYIEGDIDRISPEAPVPILAKNCDRFVPGGAANVAANVASLGGQAYLFGVIGKDDRGDILLGKLS